MAVTTNFSFTKLVGTDYAGYSTINALIDSIDSILNTRFPSASSGNYAGHNIVANLAARPATPTAGQMIYQTNTDELLKYVVDQDSTSRWMMADHDYRRNLVINGGFDVWQRGTSFNPVSATSTTGLNYGADRWQFLQATTSAAAFTRQAITATDPVGYNYYTRVQRVAAATLVTPYTVQTSFESQNIQAVRGKFVTLSFWARAGANYSNASSYLVSNIVTGTGTDNTTGNFTGNTVNTTTNNVLTTSWKRFVVTTSAVLATSITQLGVSFVFTPVGTAGAADYFDITGVQLEIGSAPSDFEFRDVGEELRRCQRYFSSLTSASSQNWVGTGIASSTTAPWVTVKWPTTMRTAPVVTTPTIGALIFFYGAASSTNPTALSATQYNNVDMGGLTFTTPAVLTGGQAVILSLTASTGILNISAEL